MDLDRPGLSVITGLSWIVTADQRWAVLGPNGSGKTTLFELASGYLHPTRGSVEILGHLLGRVDVRRLRRRIGLVSSSLVKKLVTDLPAIDVVVSGRSGALEPWWEEHPDAEWERAGSLLDSSGFGHLRDRRFGHLSDGERQQVLLARALMSSPDLLLLDEPAAGLDMGGRERLVSYLGDLAADPAHPPTVMITHHVEEIPPSFTHVLLLRDGRVVAAGPIHETLNSEAVSDTFGLTMRIDGSHGRWTCRSAP